MKPGLMIPNPPAAVLLFESEDNRGALGTTDIPALARNAQSRCACVAALRR